MTYSMGRIRIAALQEIGEMIYIIDLEVKKFEDKKEPLIVQNNLIALNKVQDEINSLIKLRGGLKYKRFLIKNYHRRKNAPESYC